MPERDVIVAGRDLGQALRARRKALGISMVAAAEAARISRVTWHRLAKGEPTVALGSLLAAAQVLGMRITAASEPESASGQMPAASADNLPLQIRLHDHPQLRRLAWQVQDDATVLSPREAFDLYQRNWRYLDSAQLQPGERALIHALAVTFGGDWPGV